MLELPIVIEEDVLFDQVGDLDDLEALLYAEPSVEIVEDMESESVLHMDEIEEKVAETSEIIDLPPMNHDCRPVDEKDSESPPRVKTSRDRARYRRTDTYRG